MVLGSTNICKGTLYLQFDSGFMFKMHLFFVCRIYYYPLHQMQR